MKALVLEGLKDMNVRDIDAPKVPANEVKIQMKYAGICGTDTHLYQGLPGSAQATPPIVLGHENSGQVVEVGADVTTIKVGDRVTIDPNIYCGHCRYCREGRPQLCENLSAVGVTRNGGLAEFVTAPESVVYPIPDELSFKAAALTEPVSCAVHGVKLLDLDPAQYVLIIGDGFIAQLFTAMIKSLGVTHVDVSGHNDQKRDLMKRLGAENVYNNGTETVPSGYDVVVEVVGAPATQAAAVDAAGKGGQVLMFGVANPDQTFALNSYDIFQKELTIKGSFINPYAFEDSLAFLAGHQELVESLISDELTFDQVADFLGGKFDHKVNKAIVNVSESVK